MVRQGDFQEDEMRFQPKEVLISVTVYFAHFVCGIRFQTDKRDRLFGSDWARMSTTLVAPAGTCIMAFYGSIGRLFETMGCYVVVNDQSSKGNRNAHHGRSGTKQLSTNKKKQNQHVKTMTMTSQNEGDGGTTHSRKKSKRKNRYDD